MRGRGEEMSSPVRALEVTPDRCPACERYIAEAPTCPYCDQPAFRSPALRGLRIASVILATAGLMLLYAGSRARPIPVVRLSELNPMMNHAAVRITGTVCRDAFVGESNGVADYVSFRIEEGGRELRVCACDTVARELVEAGSVPDAGDRVCIAGRLSVSVSGGVTLRMRESQGLWDSPVEGEGRASG